MAALLILTCRTASFTAHAGEWPVVGKDPIEAIVLEKHSEALLHWARKGFEGAVLINVDAHDDLRWVEPERASLLRELKANKDWDSFGAANGGVDDGLYHEGSFIYAAYELGIVSEVYWVIPFPYLKELDPVAAMTAFLEGYGFSREDIDTFTVRAGRYHGTRYGVPLVICDPGNLPDLARPVILTVDADFFPPFSDLNGLDMLTAVDTLFTGLSEAGYLLRDATVASSVEGGYLSVTRRWVVDRFVELLFHPEKTNAPYPREWLARGLADALYVSGRARGLIELSRRSQTQYGRDPALSVYECFALLATGAEEEAFSKARSMAREDPRYLYLLADLGQCLIDRGDLGTALRYFREAYEIDPLTDFRRKELADALMRAGEYREALRHYEVYRHKNGLFPVSFSMGAAAMEKGDEQQAMRYFEQGLRGLRNARYVPTITGADMEAIARAAGHLRERGFSRRAEFLISHPALKGPADAGR